MSDLEEQKPGVSRRTVAKAMAWSVPAVALAVPAPAYAASQGIVQLTGTGCKLPGNSQAIYKGYALKASASNTTNQPVTVTLVSATLNGSDLGAMTLVNLDGCTTLGNPFTIPANTSYPNLVILTADAPNSQNGTLVLNYTIAGQSGTQQATVNATGLGPIQGSCTAFTEAQAQCIASQGGN
jgi:hypothetical protein